MKPISFLLLIFIFSITTLSAQESDLDTIKAKSQPQVEQASSPDSQIVSSIKTHSLGVGIGQTFLLGDFSDIGEDSITLDLFYSYAASYSFDFLLNFHYSTHDSKDQEVTLPGLAFAIKAKVFQFDQFTPYVLGGLGFYRPEAKRKQGSIIQETKTKLEFGTNLGAGFDLRLNERVSFGLLFHYHNPFDVKQDVGDPLEGSYTKLMITSTYTF